MPALQAQIQTKRASRYLVQFCRHAAAMGSHRGVHLHRATRRDVQVAAEWSETTGTVTFDPWGRCTLTADADTLTLGITAEDDDALAQIRDIVTRDFERFSRRDPMAVTWQRLDTPDLAPVWPDESTDKPGFLRSNPQTILLAVAVVLVIGLHLGLAGVLSGWHWSKVAVNVVTALVGLKIALAVWARFRIRRRRVRTAPTTSDQGTRSGSQRGA